MDLGATVCTHSRPVCTICPMSGFRVAARDGRLAEPQGLKKRRDRTRLPLLIAENGLDGSRAILLERRPAPGIWGGLWSPPQFESESAALERCRQKVGNPRSRRSGGIYRSCG